MLKNTLTCRAAAVVFGAAACAGIGCAAKLDPGLAGPSYPRGAVQSRTLDVQVVRDGPRISFTNTTARPLGPGRMWVNAWYSREIPQIGVGESVTYGLGEFRDEFGAAFRAGGFFAGRNPQTLVLAQVQRAGEPEAGGSVEMLGLVVVQGEAE